MKKKLLALLLSGSMIITMVGCGSDKANVTESSAVSVESSISTESSSAEEVVSVSSEESSEEIIESTVQEVSEESEDGLAFHFPKIFRMDFEFSEEYADQMPYNISCSVDQNTGAFTMAYTAIDDSALSLEIATVNNIAYLSVGDTKVCTANTEDISSMNEGIILDDNSLKDGTIYNELGEVTENGVTYITYSLVDSEDEDPTQNILYVNKETKEVEKFTTAADLEGASTVCNITPLTSLDFSADGYTEVSEEDFGNAYMYGIFALVFGSMDMDDESLYGDYED